MKSFFDGVLFFLAALLPSQAIAQSKPVPNGSYFPSRFEPVMKADLDTSLDVSRYSLAQAKELLTKLYEADQRYRIKYHANKNRDSVRYFAKKWMVNDATNQVLFNKLLRKFGWPTISGFGKQHSAAGWYIAWHSGYAYQQKILPYLRKAYEARDIEPGHYLSIKRKIDAVKTFTSR